MAGELEHSETLRRKRRAYQARIYESKSLAAIGDELGVSANTVLAWVREQMVINLPPEEEEHLRQIDVAKIDRDEENAMFARELLKYEGQRRMRLEIDMSDVIESMRRWDDQLSKLRQERAKLLGLNKPIAVRHTHIVRSEFDEEIEELVSALSGGGHIMTLPDELEVENDDVTSSGK
jgi:hypothetical protein